MSKLTKEMMQYILKKSEIIKYGKIIIELRESTNIIDIIIENRARFEKES